MPYRKTLMSSENNEVPVLEIIGFIVLLSAAVAVGAFIASFIP